MTGPRVVAERVHRGADQQASDLGQVSWGHVSGAYQALGHRFSISTSDARLGRYLDRLYLPFRVPGTAEQAYSLLDHGDAAHPRYELHYGHERLTLGSSPSVVFGHLLWHVNQQVIERSEDLILLHAAAAARYGKAVLLPAPMESGKTTLVAGLVREGLDYLTDEAVGIQPASGVVQPFPKALSIDPGSWDTLADLRPDVDRHLAPYLTRQWQVEPGSIRPDALSGAALPRVVVFPRYEPGAAPLLQPLTPGEALRELTTCTFNFDREPRRNLRVLADVAARCRSFALTSSNLREACAAVLELLDDVDAKDAVDERV